MGKILSKVKRAYLAGLIDCDGAIIAMIEPHSEKKFKFRVRIELKFTQKTSSVLQWIKKEVGFGNIRRNRTTYYWLTRDQKEIKYLLNQLFPFFRIKKVQADLALKILSSSIHSKSDLLRIARLADTLSENNPRSRNRRKNFAVKVEESISRND